MKSVRGRIVLPLIWCLTHSCGGPWSKNYTIGWHTHFQMENTAIPTKHWTHYHQNQWVVVVVVKAHHPQFVTALTNLGAHQFLILRLNHTENRIWPSLSTGRHIFTFPTFPKVNICRMRVLLAVGLLSLHIVSSTPHKSNNDSDLEDNYVDASEQVLLLLKIFIIIPIGSGAQPPDTGLAPPEPLNLPWTSSAVQIPQLRQSKTFAGLQVTRAMVNKKRVMVRFLAISYLDTILQENSVKLQRLRQPPSSVPAQNNGQSQPPAERRTFITVLLAAEVFTPILYFSPLWPSLIFCLLFLLFLSLPHLKSSSITWRCPSVRGTIVCQRIAVLPPHYIHHTTIANSHHPNNCHHLCQRLCHQSHHCHCHGHPWSNAIKQQNKSEQSAHVYQTYHPIQQSFKRRRKPGQKPGKLLGCVSGGDPGFKARRKCREGRTEEETS